jgi:hypothetical protein
MPRQVVLLGPQRPAPNIANAMERAAVREPVALITAGWRHDEGEIDALADALGRKVVPIQLVRQFEALHRELPELAAVYRERQDEILGVKQGYHVRLRHALAAVCELEEIGERELTATEAVDEKLGAGRLDPKPAGRVVVRSGMSKGAMTHLRALDLSVVSEVVTIRARYDERLAQWDDIFAQHDAAIREQLQACEAVCIAGGQVAVLRNRMRFFHVDDALRDHNGVVFGWGAGAMALCERIVLYYDDPPDGVGNAEVFDNGLGLVPGVVAFPHARERLRLDDQARIRRLARRFAPNKCLALERGAEWVYSGGEFTDYSPSGATFTLGAS